MEEKAKLSLIVTVANNWVIGKGGKVPWHMPADLKRLKDVTVGSVVIMGRRTFESIGKPLPDRLNIVLTSQDDFIRDDTVTVPSFRSALKAAHFFVKNNINVFFIGGAQVYRSAIWAVERMYVTFIDAEFEGDTFFPKIDKIVWLDINRQYVLPDIKNPHPFYSSIFERKVYYMTTHYQEISRSNLTP